MKNRSQVLLCLLGLTLLASCSNTTENTAQNTAAPAPEAAEVLAAAAAIATHSTVPGAYFSSKAPKSGAQGEITYFLEHLPTIKTPTNTPAVSVTSSFIIDGRDLLLYVFHAKRNGCKYIHFLLGQNSASNAQSLYIAGVQERTSLHYYLKSAATTSVLTCTAVPANITDRTAPNNNPSEIQLAAPVLSQCAVVTPWAPFQKQILFAAADSMHRDYMRRVVATPQQLTQDTTASLLMETRDLENYIAEILEKQPTAHVEFHLAIRDGQITLLVDGLFGADHIYLTDGNAYYLEEHFHPCPTCANITDNGRSLE